MVQAHTREALEGLKMDKESPKTLQLEHGNAENEKNQVRDVGALLSEMGQPGRYHIFLCCLLFVINGFMASNHVTLSTTYGITPPHLCSQTSLHSYSDRIAGGSNVSISYHSCSISFYQNATNGSRTWSEKCAGPWKFASNVKTLVTEWNLVCHKKYLPSIANMLYFIGVMFGGFTCGNLSDRYGRRPILVTGLAISSVFGIAAAFVPFLSLFMIFRLIQGFTNAGVHSILYILPGETSSPKYLHYICVVVMNGFIMNVSVGCTIAWGLRNWRHIQLALSCPGIIFCALAYKFIPESLRWLSVHGKEAELIAVLKRIAAFNKVNIPDIEAVAKRACQPSGVVNRMSYGVRDIFKTRELRRRSFMMFYLWFVSAITYYGLSIELSKLTNDPYLTVLIGSLTDIPAFVLSFWYIRAFGKRRPTALFLGVGGLVCLSYIFFNSVVLVIIGKGLLAVCFGILFVYVPELYPTVIRNLGVGVCSLFSRIGSVIAPQIVLLGLYTTPKVPLAILGVLAIIAGVLTVFLPETHNQKLPDVIMDVESSRSSQLVKYPQDGETEALSPDSSA